MKHRIAASGTLLAGTLALGLAGLSAGPAGAAPDGCRVEATVSTAGTRFGLDLVIVNTGGATINGWTLRFTLTGGQVLSTVTGAVRRTVGPGVLAVNVATNGVVPPGGRVPVAFSGSHEGNVTPPPAYTVNGVGCSVVNRPRVVLPDPGLPRLP